MRFVTIARSMERLIPELIRYAFASAVALAADVAILWVLVTHCGWYYVPASVVAFVAGTSIAYLLSIRFVFSFRQLSSHPVEFGYFVALGVVGLLVNTATLALAISAAGFGLVAAKMLAACCTFATNFTLRRQLLFGPSRTP